jgi:hypothetical protein
MTNSPFSQDPRTKTGFLVGSVLLFLLGLVLYAGFQSSSGIILFFFGFTVVTAYLVLATRDNQKQPRWLSSVFEVQLILSLSFPGFVNYFYLNSESRIAQAIAWISVVFVIVACIHAFLIIRRGK